MHMRWSEQFDILEDLLLSRTDAVMCAVTDFHYLFPASMHAVNRPVQTSTPHKTKTLKLLGFTPSDAVEDGNKRELCSKHMIDN
jgi:hypothetical protein